MVKFPVPVKVGGGQDQLPARTPILKQHQQGQIGDCIGKVLHGFRKTKDFGVEEGESCRIPSQTNPIPMAVLPLTSVHGLVPEPLQLGPKKLFIMIHLLESTDVRLVRLHLANQPFPPISPFEGFPGAVGELGPVDVAEEVVGEQAEAVLGTVTEEGPLVTGWLEGSGGTVGGHQVLPEPDRLGILRGAHPSAVRGVPWIIVKKRERATTTNNLM